MMEKGNNTQENNERISRVDLYLGMASLISKRSTCFKKQVGCVIIKENRIISSGYNGVLSKEDPKNGLDEDGMTHTVHAEANAIAFAAKHGIALNQSIIYCTLSPCEKCSELIIQSGITEVIYQEEYRDRAGLDMLERHGVLCIKQI